MISSAVPHQASQHCTFFHLFLSVGTWIFSRYPNTGPRGTPTWCRNWFHSCPWKPKCVLNVQWLKSRPAQSKPRCFTTPAAVLQFTPLNCVAVPLGVSSRVSKGPGADWLNLLWWRWSGISRGILCWHTSPPRSLTAARRAPVENSVKEHGTVLIKDWVTFDCSPTLKKHLHLEQSLYWFLGSFNAALHAK